MLAHLQDGVHHDPALLFNPCSAPAKMGLSAPTKDLVLLLIEPSLRFLKPGAKTGFVFRHRDLVQLHVQDDPKVSLIHRLESVAHLAALPPDLSEKLQRPFESPTHALNGLIVQPSGKGGIPPACYFKSPKKS